MVRVDEVGELVPREPSGLESVNEDEDCVLRLEGQVGIADEIEADQLPYWA